MFFDEWNVLVVDDELDVLSVTKLALGDVQVYGLPVRLHTARSKAEAISLLNGPLMVQGMNERAAAVALVDVVMENDLAGLELCQYIREQLRDNAIQLFVRTGQPGIASERSVIDRYDISGYFTKVEATSDKLYTFVKSGIRQWFSIFYSKAIADQTYRVASHSKTRQELLAAIMPEDTWPDDGTMVNGIVFDNGATVVSDRPLQMLLDARDRLEGVEPYLTTPEGHKLVVDGDMLMVRVYETSTTVDYFYVTQSKMPMPPHLLDVTFKSGLTLATLWKNAS